MLVVADAVDVLALEHVEELVLALVEVERRVQGVDLLDDREAAAGGVRRGAHEELGVAEAQALAAAGVEREACGRREHGAHRTAGAFLSGGLHHLAPDRGLDLGRDLLGAAVVLVMVGGGALDERGGRLLTERPVAGGAAVLERH
ncbi:MAG TPA: hypothetical protein VK904_05570 [Miltoncostaeaceae bacterium]|nr:hypothetical protein [Miltoncostaeaceae bacterium]